MIDLIIKNEKRKERAKLIQKRFNKQICNEVIERILKTQDVNKEVRYAS